jgi:hypothetical protein
LVDHDLADLEAKISVLKMRKATNFTSTISDERGDELTYNGKAISAHVQEGSVAKMI